MLASLLNKRTLPFAVDCQMWKKQKTKNNIDSLHHIMCPTGLDVWHRQKIEMHVVLDAFQLFTTYNSSSRYQYDN